LQSASLLEDTQVFCIIPDFGFPPSFSLRLSLADKIKMADPSFSSRRGESIKIQNSKTESISDFEKIAKKISKKNPKKRK
jgi:hypothetical protein